MWNFKSLLLLTFYTYYGTTSETEEPVLYYYGLEESERGLPECAPRQACSAYLERYWLAPALVRLCRCARRTRCHTRAPPENTVQLNNRAHFQFCQPVTNWPVCSFGDAPLTVETWYDRMNPDELEQLHHKNIHLVPPKITFNCRCREPNYWKRNSTAASNANAKQQYQCASLPLCKSGDFCGNVNYDLYALHQTCLCPKQHMCVHNGGITHLYISELLYKGRGWRAYCQQTDDYSYEEY